MKTNTITIYSKPLPPHPPLTPPGSEPQTELPILLDLNEGTPRGRVSLETYRAEKSNLESKQSRRRAVSEIGSRRIPSIDLGPGFGESLGNADVQSWDSDSPDNFKRGRERTRPRLRVQLPPPSIGSGGKVTSPWDNPGSEFVIHADDVIPSEAPPRTLEEPVKRETDNCQNLISPNLIDHGENNLTPKVTLTVADSEEIDWPDYLLDSFEHDSPTQACNKKPNLKSSSPESPKRLDIVNSPEMENPGVSSEQNRRAPVKRKPAPPLRVYSLTLELNETNNSNAYSATDMAAQLQSLLTGDISPIAPPITPPEPESGAFKPKDTGNTKQSLNDPSKSAYSYGMPLKHNYIKQAVSAPRSHSSPPGTENSQAHLATTLNLSWTWEDPVQLGPTTEWRTLSALDLTSCDELKIYLDSLSLIADTDDDPIEGSNELSDCLMESRLSTISASCYSDSATGIPHDNKRNSASSTYSYHSNLPSPSAYIAYPSPHFKYLLIPRPLSNAVELSAEFPGPVSPTYGSMIPQESPHTSVISVGRIRLRNSHIQILNILLTPPARLPSADHEMPCRTTILKGTRRITFVRPDKDLTNGKHNSRLSSPISINTALKIGSGKGLLNRENSRRIRDRGGSILRSRGRDVYLELVVLGQVIGEPAYEAFLNRLDGSIWFVLKSGGTTSASLSANFFDQWFSNIARRKLSTNEQVVAVRWADGLDFVDPLRGVQLGAGGDARDTTVVEQRACTCGEMEMECPAAAREMAGVEIYLGEGVEEEDEGWFMP